MTSNTKLWWPALSCLPSPSAGLVPMCRTIPGDAPLFTLFRVDATSIRWEQSEAQLSSQLIFAASDARYRDPSISRIILAGGCVSHRCQLWRAAPWTPGQVYVGYFRETFYVLLSGYHSSTRLVLQFLEQRWKVAELYFSFLVILLAVFLVVSCYIFAQT